MELMVFLMIFPIGGSTRISTRLMTRAGRPARRVAGPGRVAKNFAMQFPTICYRALSLFLLHSRHEWDCIAQDFIVGMLQIKQ